MKRWISGTLAFLMVVLLFPAAPIVAESVAAVEGYTLIYDYPADLCDFTVYDWHDAEKTPIDSGGMLPYNTEKNRAYGVFTISNIAEGYRIADFLVNGVSRKDAMINGAYGGCAITINTDSTLKVVLEEVPEQLATIQSVELYTHQLAQAGSVPAANITFGVDLKGLHAVVTYADGESYPSYFASADWEYSTDGGVTWITVPGWGRSTNFNAAWSGFSNPIFCDPAMDFMTMQNYKLRVKAIPKEYYSTVSDSAGVYSPVVSVNSTGDAGSEGGEETTLHKLTAPTNLIWGTHYHTGEDGETQEIDIAGMMSWTVADTVYDHKYQLNVYHENDSQNPVFSNVWIYRAGSRAERTDHDFSNQFPSEDLPDGAYYFTLQALGDGESTSDSDVVTSGTWNYVNPNIRHEAPSYPEWNFPMVYWDNYEFTYDDYTSGYSVEYWYSATDGEAASTENLKRLGGYIWFFGEGNYNTFHTIPQSAILKNGAGYYYFTVTSRSRDILTVSHSEKTLSEACYFAGDLVTELTDDGVLTVVDQAAAEGCGWDWDGSTLTLEAVEGFSVKAVRFLPYVPEATITLNSDVTLDASQVKISSYEYRPAIQLEAPEGLLEICTGEYTLTALSGERTIYSGGSMNIVNSTVEATVTSYGEGIYVDRGNLLIQNATVTVSTGGYGEAIYVHGIRTGEEDTCEMGELTIVESTVVASSMDEEGSGIGNALYSDGDMLIVESNITAYGGNNGIGNDCGGVTIKDSTVDSVGEYLGIFSYHGITIENSNVIAEGTRAIEIASRTDELPKVETFVLKKGKITEPKVHQVALAAITYPWEDTVVSVVYDADESDAEVWTPATWVVIVPAEEEPTLNEQLSDLIPKEENVKIQVSQVQTALDGKTEELSAAMNAQLQGEENGTMELIRQLEAATGVSVAVTPTESVPFEGGSILGAALNADAQSEKVELVLDGASADLEMPEEYVNLDFLAFSMVLSGAVDADSNAENGQQLIVPVQITLPIPEGVSPEFLLLIHFLTGTNDFEIIQPKIVDNTITFVTDGFSDYALVNLVSAKEHTDGVEVKLAGTSGKTAIAAVYSGDGRMVGTVTMTNGMGKILCDPAEAVEVHFFLLDGSHAPVAPMKTVTLKEQQ